MPIKRLKVENLRNIALADVVFGPQFNFIYGINGSGKSTLLEAIYMLARARSYRSNRFGSVVRQGEKQLQLFAETEHFQKHRIGLQKTSSQTKIRVDGNNIKRVSEIARITPLQIITPMSHEILDRGPEYRKRFIEWGVFHVEHNYFKCYQQFYKALRQRNALVKIGQTDIDSWNISVGELGERVNEYRESYVEALSVKFKEESEYLNPNSNYNLIWKAGWDRSKTLYEVLNGSVVSDIKRGFTQHGPQRGDMKIFEGNRCVEQTLSRGQQKMLIVTLHLAQASLYKERTGLSPIVIIDDLISELDLDNQKKVLDRLLDQACQVFITSIDNIQYIKPNLRKDFVISSGLIKAL
ncbi:DNA replication/repair protein RecF [Sedimenticola selenatireducens]|uniref:DNA replication/repair protein RecF n=1 Tax=Sedimenticola selenatireducens TaxID=191960 RepID=UPI00164297DD|nr:DNA replication/repair protein RecF [Sedimenticola selenatireducens]